MPTSLNLFCNISCPKDPNCILSHCLFAHPLRDKPTSPPTANKNGATEVLSKDEPDENDPPDSEETTSKAEASIALPESREEAKSQDIKPTEAPVVTQTESASTAQKSISLPPSKRRRTSPGTHIAGVTQALAKDGDTSLPASCRDKSKPESLNPRMLVRTKTPAPHSTRYALVQKLHAELQRLNEEAGKAGKATRQLTPQELIRFTLDTEEEICRKQTTIYSNVIKNQIVRYRKMDIEDFINTVLNPILQESDIKLVRGNKQETVTQIETGLPEDQELALAQELKAPRKSLQESDFVLEVPSEEEIERTRQAIEATQGWEVCERCQTRFQVFPGRRSDGIMTTGGKCRHHWGKPHLWSGGKTFGGSASIDKAYTCCQEPVGISSGCTIAECHVFKASQPSRLAALLNFARTPEAKSLLFPKAVCLDCEMCYTVYGLELVRLTGTAWPTGEGILDVLVRPYGEILDLNSRFSGVWPAHLANAHPLKSNGNAEHPKEESEDALTLVSSPGEARSLLFKFLSPNTPLIGHGLENDLNAARIIHPFIVDTSLLFPHSRGLPYRNSLKMLMKKHLDRDIQLSVSQQGHDSKEDARAAGELVRWRLLQRWKKKKRDGWTFRSGELVPPTPTTTPRREQVQSNLGTAKVPET